MADKEFTKTQDYQRAKDEYTAAVATAKAGADELGEMRAELAWRDRQATLRDEWDTHQSQARALEEARAKAKTDFPQVPEVIYARLTDPKEIEQAVTEVAASLQAFSAPSAAGTQPSWPKPSGQGQPPAQERNKYDDPEYLRDLNTRFWNGNKPARNEIWDFYMARIADRMKEAKV